MTGEPLPRQSKSWDRGHEPAHRDADGARMSSARSTTVARFAGSCAQCRRPVYEGLTHYCGTAAPLQRVDAPPAPQPIITRNTMHPWTQGRYTITYGTWETWALTSCGARWKARRLKRKADTHGRRVA